MQVTDNEAAFAPAVFFGSWKWFCAELCLQADADPLTVRGQLGAGCGFLLLSTEGREGVTTELLSPKAFQIRFHQKKRKKKKKCHFAESLSIDESD